MPFLRRVPIFSPKFLLQSISFSQITNKSAPEHHHFRVFAAPKTIIFKISLLSIRSVIAHARVYCGQPECEAFGQRPGVTAGQSASQTHPTSQLQRPQFHARARSRAPHFHARARSNPLQSPSFLCPSRSGAPHFQYAMHIPTKMWAESPPPPPPPPGKLTLFQ